MKEFIDKLNEKLEEVHEMHDKSKKNAYEEEDWEKFDLLSGRNQGINIAISIINQLAEEYKVSEIPTGWISVSERLPSESGKYLVTAKNITGWWILENNVFVCDYAYDTFIFQGWEDNEVIAWMPLPAPYTEGE